MIISMMRLYVHNLFMKRAYSTESVEAVINICYWGGGGQDPQMYRQKKKPCISFKFQVSIYFHFQT